MSKNIHHQEILDLIKKHSGKPTKHTFLDSYLGNAHPRYPISVPELRKIARMWMNEHRHLDSTKFQSLLTSLNRGVSSTEKCMAGILMDISSREQRKFDPEIFDSWLDHLVGWAEIDSVCTGKYAGTEIISQWPAWKKILTRFSKSKNIGKRRASIVMLCPPLRKSKDDRIVNLAFQNINRIKKENDVLITKAISWVLRSAIKHHKPLIEKYVALNGNTLPKIALRETLTVLKTGRKTKL